VPAALGLLAVLLFWCWARGFRLAPRLVFTALFAVLPPLVVWTHLFKHYTADIAATLAVVLAVERALQEPDDAHAAWILAGVSVLALGFSFPVAFWMPIVVGVTAVRVRRQTSRAARWRAVLPAIAVFAATAAYLVFWPNVGAGFLQFAYGSAPPAALLDRLRWCVAQCAKVAAAPLLPLPLPIVALGLAVGPVVAVRERGIAALWFPLLLPLVALAGWVGQFPLAEGRFTLFLYPLIFMTFAVGLNAAWDAIPRTSWPSSARAVTSVLAATVLLALAAPSVTAHLEGRDRPREQIAPAIDIMRAAYRDGDGVFVNRLALGGWKYYARERSDEVGTWRRTPDGIEVYVGSDLAFRDDTFDADMRRVFTRRGRVFFVLTHLEAPERAFVLKHAARWGEVKEIHARDGAWTWIVTRRPSAPEPAALGT
jgi:hypothetical protein